MERTLLVVVIVVFSTQLTVESNADVTDTVIELTAPVNPVDEHGMISLHCQVRNKETGHTITITREHGKGRLKRLTFGKDILSEEEVGDRVFLAIRQLNDGSIVYFLSITEISREDAGKYSCAAVDENLDEIASKSVDVTAYYLHSDIYPVCTPGEPPEVYEGVPFRIGCSSEEAYPSVSLKWSRTGDGVVPELEVYKEHGMVHAEIEILPTLNDQDAVFLCEATSRAFPINVYSCHVGPINVIPREDGNYWDGFEPDMHTSNAPSGAILDNTPSGKTISENIANVPSEYSCKDPCSVVRSPVFYWMLATAGATFLGLLFLIVGIVLYIKMKNHRDLKRSIDSRFMSRDIYVEVDQKCDENQLYMSLDKAMHRTLPTGVPLQLHQTSLEHDECYNSMKKTMLEMD